MRRRYLATTRLPSGATLMLERELKLYVPEASRIGLKKALTQLGATELALNARYFDTENRDLAKAGLALRLRQERSEEHTSELQSLMRHSYAVFCLKKKTN